MEPRRPCLRCVFSLLFSLILAGPGLAAPGVCLVTTLSTPLDVVVEYRAALRIEGRKAQAQLDWQVAEQIAACSPGFHVLTIGPGPRAQMARAEGGGHTYRLSASAPARELAQAVIRDLLSPPGRVAELEPLVDEQAFTAGEQTVSAQTPERPSPWRAQASAAYLYQPGADRHLMGPTLHLRRQVSHRMALGVQAAALFAGGRERSGLSDDLSLIEVLALAGLSAEPGPVSVGVRLGFGWQRRSVVANSTGQRAADRRSDSQAAVLALDLEGRWPAEQRWWIEGALTPRAYAGGPRHLWLDREVYDAPAYAMGARMGAGVRW